MLLKNWHQQWNFSLKIKVLSRGPHFIYGAAAPPQHTEISFGEIFPMQSKRSPVKLSPDSTILAEESRLPVKMLADDSVWKILLRIF